MLSAKIGHSLDPLIAKVYKCIFFGKDLRPNTLSLLGFLFGIVCFVFILFGRLFLAGIFLAISGFFDLLDGSIARRTNRVTLFGGLLDSVLDRYTDLLVISAIGIHFVFVNKMVFAVMAMISTIGVAIIPYVKARAQAEGLSCDTGILERPERMILLIVGLLFGFIDYCIVILAFLSHVTVLQRIIFFKRRAELLKAPE